MGRIDYERAAWRRQQVIDLSAQKMTVEDIAIRMGVTTRTVNRHRQDAGISTGPKTRVTEREKLKAKALLDDGASYCEVGRTLRRNQQTIEKHLPGYRKRTSIESAEAAALGRELARLERTLHFAIPMAPKDTAAECFIPQQSKGTAA